MGIMGTIKKITAPYPEEDIVKARIVGVRTAEDTKVLATYNYGIYSVLIKYKDGTVELAEEQFDSAGMKILLKFMDV